MYCFSFESPCVKSTGQCISCMDGLRLRSTLGCYGYLVSLRSTSNSGVQQSLRRTATINGIRFGLCSGIHFSKRWSHKISVLGLLFSMLYGKYRSISCVVCYIHVILIINLTLFNLLILISKFYNISLFAFKIYKVSVI